MQKSSRPRKHWTAEERKNLLQSFRRSSLTHKKFALHAGVSVSTLYAWLRKATVNKESGRSAFVAVPNLLSPVPAAPAYRLQWPDGLSLEVRAGFSSEELAVLLQLLPAEIVERIGQLYAVEEKARQAGLGPVERQALRQSESAPIMEALKVRLVEIRQQIPPGGKLAQACDYVLGQWSRLEVFLSNGLIEADNNWCHAARGMSDIIVQGRAWH